MGALRDVLEVIAGDPSGELGRFLMRRGAGRGDERSRRSASARGGHKKVSEDCGSTGLGVGK